MQGIKGYTHNTVAQSTVEYVMVVGFVIAALAGMIGIFMRIHSGRMQQIQDYVIDREE